MSSTQQATPLPQPTRVVTTVPSGARTYRSPSNGRSATTTSASPSSPPPSQPPGKLPGSAERTAMYRSPSNRVSTSTSTSASPFASPPQAAGGNERQQLLPSGLRKTPSRQSMTSMDEEEAGQKKGGGGGGTSDTEKGDPKTLAVSFLAMVVVGVGNRIFGKLETYPMYNYPFFLSCLCNFIYIPFCFAYIWPMMLWGKAITKDQMEIPKYKFAVMGLFDCISGIMQGFAINYISNGALIVLLQQSAIPISMYMSRICLNAHYRTSQYVGAFIVMLGIIVVLIPTFEGKSNAGVDEGGDVAVSKSAEMLWIVVLVISCIPMSFSSVYKEMALGEQEIDVLYLNGWVAIFQFLFSIPLVFPSAYLSNLRMSQIPGNLIGGARCYFLGVNTLLEPTPGHPPDDCSTAVFYVTTYLAFNIVYNVLTIVILKHASSNVLFIASTVMVPINNIAFSLKMVPGHQPMEITDLFGLIFILLGLIVYRFYSPFRKWRAMKAGLSTQQQDIVRQLTTATRKAERRNVAYFGINQTELLEPLLDYRVARAQEESIEMLIKKSHGQIRGSFLLRLGIPPSPDLGAGYNSPGIPSYKGSSFESTSPRRPPPRNFRAGNTSSSSDKL